MGTLVGMERTLFDLVDQLGQVEVARRLGLHRSVVNRIVRAKLGVSERLVQRCEQTAGLVGEGETFDAEGTLAEWYRRRCSPSDGGADAHAQQLESGHAA